MSKTNISPSNVANTGIPIYYRERFSDTTLGKFKNRLLLLISALDAQESETPVRQFIGMHKNEMQISAWINNCFVSLTINAREDDL